jgi:hypothetical protein
MHAAVSILYALTDGNSVISEEKGCNLIVLTEK